MTEPKIPKFGSFKSAKPTSVLDVPHSPEPSNKYGTDKKHRRSEKKEEPEKPRHGQHRSQPREKTQIVQLGPSQAHHQQELIDIFVVDRKGDEKNLIYGSIHRYNIPPFHRYGAGYVLGLSTDLKITRNLGDDKELAIGRWRDSRSNTREKYVFSKVAKEKPRLLRIRPQDTILKNAPQEEDFVPFTTFRGQKRKRVDPREYRVDSPDSDKDERDYRSIYGSNKAKDTPSDEELRYATESESSGSDAGHTIKTDPSIQRCNIELSRKVEQSPHDIENWLALIDHQDILLMSGDDRRRITNAEMRSTADIKIHMYEKALEKMTSLGDRERLLIGLMTEGSKIWEVKVQSDRWEQISNDNIDSLILWTHYLNFKQSNFATFHYEEIRELFIQRIKLLTRAVVKAKSTSLPALFNQLLYVTLRLTLFIRESGYSELSIAIWQAILEVNFFGPEQSLPRDEVVRLFKDFWESEVPRLGEDNSTGWRQFIHDETSTEVPDIVVDEPDNYLNDTHLFNSWATAEQLRSQISFPARTMDEVVEDDPYRVILFSDIDGYIIVLPDQEELRKLCIDAFLLFCRLPIMTGSMSQAHAWSLDTFVKNELLECKLKLSEDVSKLSTGDDGHEGNIRAILKHSIQNYQNSSDTLFSTDSWFGMSSWDDQFGAGNEPVPYKFARNVLKQLAHSSSFEELAEHHLAFENINEPITIKKQAKAVLKQHPSSLRLYNAYAMIEWPRNREVAKGVLTAALSIASMPEHRSDNGSVVLWRSWIWACLEDHDLTSARGLLLSIPHNNPDSKTALSPTVLLKSKQHLSSKRDLLLSIGAVDQAVLYAECLALLDYLTGESNTELKSSTQGDITAALLAFDTFGTALQARFQSSSAAQELLLQSTSRLLLLHARSGPYRPSLLRLHLSKFITLFPQNTIFLSLYAWNERNLRVENRMRAVISSVVLKPRHDNVVSRVFAINHEISYGTIYSAKAAFEHGVSSTACKNSPGIWRFYLCYLLSVPQFRSNVKDVWYRALKACPWAKKLYMLGFEKLGPQAIGGVAFGEMRSTWRVMGEKELRVHVDLEEKFEDIGELEDNDEVDGRQHGRKKLGYK